RFGSRGQRRVGFARTRPAPVHRRLFACRRFQVLSERRGEGQLVARFSRDLIEHRGQTAVDGGENLFKGGDLGCNTPGGKRGRRRGIAARARLARADAQRLLEHQRLRLDIGDASQQLLTALASRLELGGVWSAPNDLSRLRLEGDELAL